MEDFSRYNSDGTKLRRVQLRILDLLIELDRICRKNNIPYWIEFGTLLGAVRHKGFIPWDDDIDICVMNEDYQRLRECLIRELPENMVFQDSKTDPYVHSYYGRIRDKKSYCYYPLFRMEKDQGLWLDIFRVDRVPSLAMKNFVDYFFRRSFREIHHYGEVRYHNKLQRKLNKVIAYLIYPFTCLGVYILRFLGKYCKHAKLTRLTIPINSVWYESDIFPLSQIEFEGHMFPAPNRIDANLRSLYGDYMRIPPEEKRDQILDMDKVEFLD